jgi:hypothetical protein
MSGSRYHHHTYHARVCVCVCALFTYPCVCCLSAQLSVDPSIHLTSHTSHCLFLIVHLISLLSFSCSRVACALLCRVVSTLLTSSQIHNGRANGQFRMLIPVTISNPASTHTVASHSPADPHCTDVTDRDINTTELMTENTIRPHSPELAMVPAACFTWTMSIAGCCCMVA